MVSLQHHFRYSTESPGVVLYKKFPEMEWKTAMLLKADVSVVDVLSAGNEGSRFRALSDFVLGPTPIEGNRLKACKEVVKRYSGYLGDGKRFFSPCTF